MASKVLCVHDTWQFQYSMILIDLTTWAAIMVVKGTWSEFVTQPDVQTRECLWKSGQRRVRSCSDDLCLGFPRYFQHVQRVHSHSNDPFLTKKVDVPVRTG